LRLKISHTNDRQNIYFVGYQERMKDFFKAPPRDHPFKVGDLVTCKCHGGLAIIIELYDEGSEIKMNMAKIWWIIYPHTGVKERDWMHTIDELEKFSILRKIRPRNF
jgi:hypothetical protein